MLVSGSACLLVIVNRLVQHLCLEAFKLLHQDPFIRWLLLILMLVDEEFDHLVDRIDYEALQ